MGKKSNITHECIKSLKKQERFGNSKYEDKLKAKEEARNSGEQFKNVTGLYSFKSEQTYIKNCKHFIQYCMDNHRNEIKHYSDCRPFVEEYLQNNIDRDLSAWTIHTRASALCCSYGIRIKDLDIELPQRNRADIVRSRGTNSAIYRNPEERYQDIKTFLRATGCRREEALNLRTQDIKYSKNGKNIFIYKRGKGGVERWTLVNPQYNQVVKRFFDERGFDINGETKLFRKSDLPRGTIHSLRADYAKDMYKLYEANNMGNGKKYHCRGERVGDSFDRGILEKISYNLGHHRVDVVVNNYLYDFKGGK